MLTGVGAALTVLAVRVARRVQSLLRVFSRSPSEWKQIEGAHWTTVLLGRVSPSWAKLRARYWEVVDQIVFCFLSGLNDRITPLCYILSY